MPLESQCQTFEIEKPHVSNTGDWLQVISGKVDNPLRCRDIIYLKVEQPIILIFMPRRNHIKNVQSTFPSLSYRIKFTIARKIYVNIDLIIQDLLSDSSVVQIYRSS